MKLSSNLAKIAIQIALLLLLAAGAAGTRRHVLNAQRQLTADRSIPFSL